MTNQNKKGFTIIEVVLVLAIAGMIFLVVFLALPALQRSQRDQARKSNVGTFVTTVAKYQSNNNGTIPSNQTELRDMMNSYLRCTNSGDVFTCEDFADPTTGDATVSNRTTDGAPSTEGVYWYADNAQCNGGSIDVDSSFGSRQFAFATFLEDGGSFCQDNQ